MEFFIPSLFVLLFSAIVVFLIMPKFGPTALLITSIALLAFGIYHHASLFKDEYRSSTWQNVFVAYGPYIMLGGLLIFILFYVFSSFGGGAVPVPSMPEGTMSPMSVVNSITSTVTSAANSIKNTITGNSRGNSYNGNKVRKSFFNVV